MPPRGPLWDWVGLDAIWQALETLCQKVDALTNKVDTLGEQERERDMAEQEEITNLIQQVTANRDAVEATKMALTGLVDMVEDGQRKLEEALANSSDVSPAIKQAADELAANTEALRAAIPPLAQAVGDNT